MTPKKTGPEWRIANFPRFDVILKIKATISIRNDPFSLKMALKGSQNPFLIESIFNVYAPMVISRIPIVPEISGSSPSMMNEVRIRNRGVKARNGMVRERGEILIALIERIIAAISRGSSRRMISQKVLSRCGISIKGRMAIRYGMAKRCLTHVRRYSSVVASDFLVRASVVAEKKAERRAYTIHIDLQTLNLNSAISPSFII